jgi:hypothetical protein
MLPAEWAERHDSGAASQWTHALMRDERGIHLLCSCMLYANFRSRSATQVRERERERERESGVQRCKSCEPYAGGVSGGRSLTRPFRDARRFPSTRL